MKAILALANYGGGLVLIGFREENGTWVPRRSPGRLVSLLVSLACQFVAARVAQAQLHYA